MEFVITELSKENLQIQMALENLTKPLKKNEQQFVQSTPEIRTGEGTSKFI